MCIFEKISQIYTLYLMHQHCLSYTLCPKVTAMTIFIYNAIVQFALMPTVVNICYNTVRHCHFSSSRSTLMGLSLP